METSTSSKKKRCFPKIWQQSLRRQTDRHQGLLRLSLSDLSIRQNSRRLIANQTHPPHKAALSKPWMLFISGVPAVFLPATRRRLAEPLSLTSLCRIQLCLLCHHAWVTLRSHDRPHSSQIWPLAAIYVPTLSVRVVSARITSVLRPVEINYRPHQQSPRCFYYSEVVTQRGARKKWQ